MPLENDNLDHMRNRLLDQARERENEAKQFRTAAMNLEEAQRLARGLPVMPHGKPARGQRGGVMRRIMDIAKGHDEAKRIEGFTAEELGQLIDLPYNNIYESLRRLCSPQKRLLVREGPEGHGRFYLPGYEPSKRGS